MRSNLLRLLLPLVLLLSTFAAVPVAAAPATPDIASAHIERYLVRFKNPGDLAAVTNDAQLAGGDVVEQLPALNTLVVSGSETVHQRLTHDPRVATVARDRIQRVVPPELTPNAAGPAAPTHIDLGQPIDEIPAPEITADPAFNLSGLLWNLERIGAPTAWETTIGSPDVTVGVADTGLDFTHVELASKVSDVVDFTAQEDPPLCSTYFGTSDQDLAEEFGGPAETDWNGHGSWIGGNIAAAMDGQGINGIAPGVSLVSLKIAQWCGYAYDSSILNAFTHAADEGIDVVSISFGGYLNLNNPDEAASYNLYVDAVDYALSKGTIIVAAAGNEHVQVGPGGEVLSHGSLTAPGNLVQDLFGLYEVPGGVPGVVNVAATGNVVNATIEECPTGTADNQNATCKLTSDEHQPFGMGEQDQLAYYSNYGPRIDIAAPGGARKFNLPVWDRGGSPGFPVTTADDFSTWETFSITSNWSVSIPCYINLSSEFPADQCYSTIQGTSMATPHVSAVLALIASAHESARHNPDELLTILKATATKVENNATPPVSADDTSKADLTGATCPSGYCHLGGEAISAEEAYGAGVVNAAAAVTYQPEEVVPTDQTGD